MSYQAGYKTVLKFDAKTIVGYRTTGMDIDADMAEATTGESTNQWKEYIPMFKGMTFSVSGLYDPDTENESVDDVIILIKAGTKFTAKFGGEEVGDKYESADAYISHVSVEGPYDDLKSYTIDVQVTGEPTTGTVTE